MKPSDTPRKIAFSTLLPYAKGLAQAPLDMAEIFSHAPQLSVQEKSFLYNLTYGILRYWLTLQAMVNEAYPQKKLAPEARTLLYMALYQGLLMDSVPHYAAISSTLALADDIKLPKYIKSVIHGVFNSICKKNKASETLPIIRFPDWWQDKLIACYGREALTEIQSAFSTPPQRYTIRLNTQRVTVADFVKDTTHRVVDEGEGLVEIAYAEALPQELPGYRDGLFMVQDRHAAKAAKALQATLGSRVLEIGAAPGTKTVQLSQYVGSEGHVVALEKSKRRAQKITENLQRMNCSNVTLQIQDALTFNPSTLFDFILLDSPCSGTGTIRKNPDILRQLSLDSIQKQTLTQSQLLHHALTLLNPQGRLVYSTCSIEIEENEALVLGEVAKQAGGFEVLSSTQYLPSLEADGFYIAVLRRLS
jgi:16S rRNA (cytosine967-C5)-methyltransferase